MQIWTTLQLIESWPYWVEVGAIFLFLAGIILKNSHLHFCLKIIKKPNKKYLRLFFNNLKLPLQWILILSSIGIATDHLHLINYQTPIILHTYKTIMVFLINWGIWRQTSHTKDWIELYSKEFNHSFHEIAVPLIRRGARLLITIIFILVLSTIWGFSTQNTIAGVGVVGIVISLSANDLIKNTLSAFFLLVNNVFDIGEWVQIGSSSGSVESISLRFTKIRTKSNAVVSVPNSQIANTNVTNWSRRHQRFTQLTFTLNPKCSGDLLYKCVNHIQNKLMFNEAIYPHSLSFRLNTKGNAPPNLTFRFELRPPYNSKWSAIKLGIYRDITALLEEYGIEQLLPLSSTQSNKPIY